MSSYFYLVKDEMILFLILIFRVQSQAWVVFNSKIFDYSKHCKRKNSSHSIFSGLEPYSKHYYFKLFSVDVDFNKLCNFYKQIWTNNSACG